MHVLIPLALILALVLMLMRGLIKGDDFIVGLFLGLALFRRLEASSVRRVDNPNVSDADFSAWRSLTLRGYSQLAIASFAKIALSIVWFQVFKNTNLVLQAGGVTIFVVWAIVSVMAWRPITEAAARRRELRIGHTKE